MLPRWLMLLAVSLSFSSFTCAGDAYNEELRLLDLELEMLSLKSQMLLQQQAAINARLHETHTRASAENADLQRDLSSYPERHGMSRSPLELDHSTVLDPEPLFPHDASGLAAARGPFSADAGGTTGADVGHHV